MQLQASVAGLGYAPRRAVNPVLLCSWLHCCDVSPCAADKPFQVKSSGGTLWWYKAEAVRLADGAAPSTSASDTCQWRDQAVTKKYCSRAGADEEGPLCQHGSDIIRTDHWSCCGVGTRDAPCTKVGPWSCLCELLGMGCNLCGGLSGRSVRGWPLVSRVRCGVVDVVPVCCGWDGMCVDRGMLTPVCRWRQSRPLAPAVGDPPWATVWCCRQTTPATPTHRAVRCGPGTLV